MTSIPRRLPTVMRFSIEADSVTIGEFADIIFCALQRRSVSKREDDWHYVHQ